MPIVKNPKHIFEPTPLQCGQAVLSMLSGVQVSEIIDIVGTDRETTLKQMFLCLDSLDIKYDNERCFADKKENLPKIALLSLETPKCWHWSLYYEGLFLDPEYGILEDFPPSKRRYFWKIY